MAVAVELEWIQGQTQFMTIQYNCTDVLEGYSYLLCRTK